MQAPKPRIEPTSSWARDDAIRIGRVVAIASSRRLVAVALGRAWRRTGRAAVLRGHVVPWMAGLIVDGTREGVRYARGDIDAAELRRRATVYASSAAGGTGGTLAGALVGSLILPGAGSAIGAFLGGIAGSMSAESAARYALERSG